MRTKCLANFFDRERYTLVSSEEVPPGRVELKAEVELERNEPGAPATVRLFINGRAVGQEHLERTVRGRFGLESLNVGLMRLPSGTSTCTSVGTRVSYHHRTESSTAATSVTANATTTTASRTLRMVNILAPPPVS